MKEIKNIQLNNLPSINSNQKGGVTVSRLAKAIDIVQGYDWMLNNPDTVAVSAEIKRQVEEEGILRLCIFVCPKFDTTALFTASPEEYMPERVVANDLFEPRIARILQLRGDLQKLGIQTELNVLLGDNDAEVYIFPYVKDFKFSIETYRRRQKIYAQNFERRVNKALGKNCIVWSLSAMDVVPEDITPEITAVQWEKEMRFFEWLYSLEGPYRARLSFSQGTLSAMVKLKYSLYGSQGKFLQKIGGILLQTEGPGVWLERTQMLRCTGSPAIPVIYPWIRAEELENME